MKFKKVYSVIVFIVFLLLCSYPIFLNLGKLSVRMWDEARNGINAMEMLNDHNFIVTHFDKKPDMWNSKPPFFIWMVALSMKLFGTTAFALRLPSALSCLAIMIYGFWFCRKYLNSVWSGILSGLVLATSVGFIECHVTRNGDFDAMLSMWIFFYSTQFYIYLEYGRKNNLLLFALFLSLAILTKGIAGCLFLPGLLVFTFIYKNHYHLLNKKEFYIIPIAGLLVGISYYFIRDIFNPGYISAVIENEITGRYIKTVEGHVAPAWYYMDLLKEYHLKYWIWFIPLSFVFILFRGDTLLKKIYLFLFIQTSFYLVIISISQSKLSWYDAPLFPFFAMMIAIGLAQVFIEFKKISFLKNPYIKEIFFIFLCFIIFIIPKQEILATSISGEKETFYPELFYGDFINSVYTAFPQQKSLTILLDDYNPHLFFYKTVRQTEGLDIRIIPLLSNLKTNDSILVCELKLCPKLDSGLVYDTLLQEDNLKYFMRVTSGSNITQTKINN